MAKVKKLPDDDLYLLDKAHRKTPILYRYQDYMVGLEGSYPDHCKYRCEWCKNFFETKPLGVPLRRIEHEEETIYLCEGFFCSFECVNAAIQAEENKINRVRNQFWDNASPLLYEIYSSIYPGEKMKVAPHWTLLSEYGGPYSIEEFRSNQQLYQRTPNFRILPVAIVYQKIM